LKGRGFGYIPNYTSVPGVHTSEKQRFGGFCEPKWGEELLKSTWLAVTNTDCEVPRQVSPLPGYGGHDARQGIHVARVHHLAGRMRVAQGPAESDIS
jgi:hypothetical protein